MSKKVITEEQRAKMEAASAARRETREKVLRIGEWQIFQGDPENWVLRKGDDGENRYYPTLEWCLKVCLHEKIGERHATSIQEVLAAIKQSEAAILAGLAHRMPAGASLSLF